MIYTNIPANINLTDELERALVQQAIEEQFRPHPLRALRAWMGKMFAPAVRVNPMTESAAQA